MARNSPSNKRYHWRRESQHGCLDREIDVLGDIVDCCRELDCIELADDDSDNVSALIEHLPAAVTRLYRRRNLEISGVVTQASDSRNIADCEISARGEQPYQRIAESGNSLADLYANPE